MEFSSIDELKKKITEISKKGFIKSHRLNNTGIGKTFEDEIGIVENNIIKGGDLKIGNQIAEVKTQRSSASSRVTLSTKEPKWLLDKLETIKKTGYKDLQGRLGLKITLSNLGYNQKKYRLTVDDGEICIVHEVLGKVCLFKTKELVELIKSKLGENLLFVLADVKKDKEIEYFHYNEAYYFSDFDEEVFINMIKEGDIIWEFRLHLKPSGAIRDHGSGFRTAKKYLSELYKNKTIILSAKQK